MGAGESGMLSRPARRRTAVEQPLTGPLARAAGLRGPLTTLRTAFTLQSKEIIGTHKPRILVY